MQVRGKMLVMEGGMRRGEEGEVGEGMGLNTRGGFLVRGGEVQMSGKVLLKGGMRQRELGAAK